MGMEWRQRPDTINRKSLRVNVAKHGNRASEVRASRVYRARYSGSATALVGSYMFLWRFAVYPHRSHEWVDIAELSLPEFLMAVTVHERMVQNGVTPEVKRSEYRAEKCGLYQKNAPSSSSNSGEKHIQS